MERPREERSVVIRRGREMIWVVEEEGWGMDGLEEGEWNEERAFRRDLGVVCLVRLWIWEERCGRRV